MLVHDFAYVEAPAAAVRTRLLEGAGAWLGGYATHAAGEGDDIRVRLGPTGLGRPLGKEIVVTMGEPQPRGTATIIPLTWRAAGAAGLFPVFRGDLEVAVLGERHTQLSLWGQYDPPFGTIGGALDRIALHRIAEASVRAFLRDVARALSQAGA